MDADLFLQQFGHLAKCEGGIKKLRDVILQLAVRGKLLEQNPSDDPADVLLKKIEAEKKRLVKEGKIRAREHVPLVKKTDDLFTIPANWAWVSLGNIQVFTNGFAFKSQDYQDTGVGIVRIGDIVKGNIASLDMKKVPEHFLETLDKSLQVRKHDVVIAMSGATTGKIGINNTDEVFLLNQRVGKIEPILVNKQYLLSYLETKIAENLAKSMGSAIPNLSTAQINEIEVPLPPLAEQKRIVAKVDELMALCDKLEAEQKAQRTLKTQAVQSTLHHLTSAENPASFGTSLNILERTFGNWFDDLATVKHLRATILQLAVQGKLVPQNPTDEPASELLKRIEVEKKRLVKEGKIKKSSVISDSVPSDSEPFNLPYGWAWSLLCDITLSISDGDHQAPPQADRGIPFLVISNVRNGTVDTQKASRFVPESYYEGLDRQRKPEKGDILYTVTGSIGIPVIVDTEDKFCFQRHIAIIKPLDNSDRRYLHLYLKSDLALEQATKSATGIAQLTIPLKSLRSLLVPLPPLAEQKRIVAKVDELMTLCDQLEAHITNAKTINTHLMDSLIHRIVAR
jgi:type I restriction enzyme S subunit